MYCPYVVEQHADLTSMGDEVVIVDVIFVYLQQLIINYNHVPKLTAIIGQ
jgi:hypothetical protein